MELAASWSSVDVVVDVEVDVEVEVDGAVVPAVETGADGGVVLAAAEVAATPDVVASGEVASSATHAVNAAQATTNRSESPPEDHGAMTVPPGCSAETPRLQCLDARRREYDAIVIGAGPNGLVAATTLARAGLRVLVVEAAATPGGGCRTAELTEPGFRHDVCSAIHPFAVASPALRALPLEAHGLRWIQPDVPLAHPLAGGAAVLHRSRRRHGGRARRRRCGVAPADGAVHVGRNAVRRRPAVAAVDPPAPGRPGPLRPHRHPPGNERRPRPVADGARRRRSSPGWPPTPSCRSTAP